MYWQVADLIKQNLLFNYNDQFSFFNTETGNFTLFRSQDELIIAEIISIEEHAVIPLSGIEFEIDSANPLELHLFGMTCFFDSSMTIESRLTSQECLLDVGKYGV